MACSGGGAAFWTSFAGVEMGISLCLPWAFALVLFESAERGGETTTLRFRPFRGERGAAEACGKSSCCFADMMRGTAGLSINTWCSHKSTNTSCLQDYGVCLMRATVDFRRRELMEAVCDAMPGVVKVESRRRLWLYSTRRRGA